MLTVNAAVVWVPLVASVPDQLPEAVHELALVELQDSTEVPPLATLVGDAVNVALGVATTVTAAVAGVLVPPAPVQVNEYVLLAVSAPVLWLPLVETLPVQSPEAVQAVAFVELQVSVAELPVVTDVGVTLKFAVGTGFVGMLIATVTGVALLVPPGPVQLSE